MADSTVAKPTVRAPRELPEIRSSGQAKADLRKAENPDFKALTGGAIRRAMLLVGWSLKELAGALDKDPRQVARWLDGRETPHFHALFAIECLRQPLVIAFAEMADAEVETVIRVVVKR
jgi:ribosome-binding protein aMBF1 (putative translation factor)